MLTGYSVTATQSHAKRHDGITKTCPGWKRTDREGITICTTKHTGKLERISRAMMFSADWMFFGLLFQIIYINLLSNVINMNIVFITWSSKYRKQYVDNTWHGRRKQFDISWLGGPNVVARLLGGSAGMPPKKCANKRNFLHSKLYRLWCSGLGRLSPPPLPS